MGYAENVIAGQARETNHLLAKQVAVQLETNRLLRRLLAERGVTASEPPVGSPAGDPAPKSALAKFFDAF